MKIKDAKSASFSLLSGTMRPMQAITRLAGKDYGIIVHKRELHGLVTLDDLNLASGRDAPSLFSRQTKLPPMVIAGCNIDMRTFIESGAASSFLMGAHGAVLIDSTGVVGVIPVKAIDKYIKRRRLEYGYGITAPTPYQVEIGKSSGGYMLGGRSDEDTTPLIAVKCTTCGWPNFLPFIPLDDEDLPICSNPKYTPHKLGVVR